jgi:hypothetical protein
MRGLIIFVFICLYALLTFFGLGPVVFADGSMQERLLTLAVVVILYILLTFILRQFLKRKPV